MSARISCELRGRPGRRCWLPSYFLAISSLCQQKRIGCDDAGKLPQGRASHDLGLLSEPPSLGVREAQPFVAHLFTEYAVLLFEVIDCILLCTIDPTRPHHQQELQRQVHEGYRIPFIQTDQTKWLSEERAQDLKHHPIPVSGVLAPYGDASRSDG